MKNKSLSVVFASICITLLMVMMLGSVSLADGTENNPPVPSPPSCDTITTGSTSSIDEPVEVFEITQKNMSIADYIIIAVGAIL